MKKFRNIIALGLLLSMASCGNYLDINTNPNAPAVSVPDPVLAGALVETARIHVQDAPPFAAYWAGYWATSGTYSSANAVQQNYKLLNTSYQNLWSDVYLNLENYQFVLNSASDPSMAYYKGIAMIMKAYGFHTLVDVYNDIPYSNALKGFQNLNPTYDAAKSVYEGEIANLQAAVALIKAGQAAGTATKTMPATTDIMFKGNMDSWIRLANTMRLRLLLRLSPLGPPPGNGTESALITDQMADLVSANSQASDNTTFLGVGQDAQINPGYQKAQGLQSPMWESYGLGVGGDVGSRDYNRTSNYSLQFYKNNNDPRLDYFFRLPGKDPGTSLASLGLSNWVSGGTYTAGTLVLYNDGVTNTKVWKCIKNVSGSTTGPNLDGTNWAFGYLSIDFGAPPTTALATGLTSGFGGGVMPSPGGAITFLSAAEGFFLQAEAVQRGWMSGNAQTLWQQGIAESFRLVGVPNASTAAAAYTNSSGMNANKPNVDWNASTPLQAIIIQKWAANCSINAMEAWCDLRRTGFPNDLPNSLDPNRIGPGPSPIRLLYPQTEYNVNAAAVASYPNDQSSVFTNKIFWMP